MRKFKVGDKVRWKHESTVRTLVAPCPDYSDSWYISTAYSSCSEKYLTLVEPPLKFKAGQKVRVIANTNHHQYEIGQTIELEQLYDKASDGVYRWLSSTFENGEKWFVSVEDIEPIEEQSEQLTEDKEPLNHVTTRVLDVALRACGIGLPYEIIDKVIDLVELIQTTEGETTLKDIAELQAEWENK